MSGEDDAMGEFVNNGSRFLENKVENVDKSSCSEQLGK